ncbi:phage head closure protein [Escherichia albertii]|uniref:phage head closure protein n=1 Tax=Escherichia albertii TaxID=208962 RepID=UPI00242DF973
MAIYSGRLNDAVTIQNPATTRAPSGHPVEEWVSGKTVHAEVAPVGSRERGSGREGVVSGAETAVATVRVWMRWRTDVTAGSRLLCQSGPFKGVTLSVVGPPIPDSKGQRMEVMCKQGVEK